MGGALKSKTLWFAAALAALGVLEQSTEVLRPVLGEQNLGLLMVGVGAIVAALRVVTTKPLSRK